MSAFSKGGRLVRGAIVLGWIVFLMYAAMLSWSQRAASVLEDVSDTLTMRKTSAIVRVDEEFTAQSALADFLARYREDPPPLAQVLGKLVGEPRWDDATRYDFWTRLESLPEDETDYVYKLEEEEFEKLIKDETAKIERAYLALFAKVANALNGLASNPLSNPAEFRMSKLDLPKHFLAEGTPEAMPAAPKGPSAAASAIVTLGSDEVTAWVNRERERLKMNEQKEILANTFLLLLVLGALGSTIFLTRDFINEDHTTTLSAYFFRPVLGMFLALGIFVVDVLAHTVVSTSAITDIRREPLMFLAFAAGLLSEQTYTVIEARARQALEKYKEQGAESSGESA